MSYICRGSLRTEFVISAAELLRVLAGQKVHLVVWNHRVAADYEETPLKTYAEDYGRYVEAMLSEDPVPWSLESVVGITVSRTTGIYAWELCPEPEYKCVRIEEPVVSLSPRNIWFDGQTLCQNVLSGGEACFGLSMYYPQAVCFARDNYQWLHDAAQFRNGHLWADLNASIQAITSPCRIQSSARVHRTEIRISQEMRERINGHPGLRRLGLMVL